MRFQTGRLALYAVILLGILTLTLALSENCVRLPLGGTVYAQDQASPAEGAKISSPVATGDAAMPATEDLKLDTIDQRTAAYAETVQTRQLYETLRARERALDARERALEKEAEALDVARVQVEQEIQKLIELQKLIGMMLARADAQKNKEVKNLLDIYRSMKPETILPILEQMDEEMKMQILTGLDITTQSKILELMPAEKAAEISQKLVSIPKRSN